MIAAWGGFKNRIYTITFACLLLSCCTIGLGLAPLFWFYVFIMAVAGVSLPLFNTPAMVMIQSNVEPAFMGRVFSVLTMTGSVMMPLGMLIFGPLTDNVNINYIFIGTGIMLVLLCVPLLFSKVLREAGKMDA